MKPKAPVVSRPPSPAPDPGIFYKPLGPCSQLLFCSKGAFGWELQNAWCSKRGTDFTKHLAPLGVGREWWRGSGEDASPSDSRRRYQLPSSSSSPTPLKAGPRRGSAVVLRAPVGAPGRGAAGRDGAPAGDSPRREPVAVTVARLKQTNQGRRG